MVKETRSRRNFHVRGFKIQVRYALNRRIFEASGYAYISVKVKSDVAYYNLDQISEKSRGIKDVVFQSIKVNSSQISIHIHSKFARMKSLQVNTL